MEKTQQAVTKDMVVAEVLERHPIAADIMQSHGLSCTGCSINTMDTVEAGAFSHGMSDSQVEEMVRDINEAIVSGKAPAKEVPQGNGELAVTDHAARKMKEILAQQKKEGWGIRVMVSAGGCAGFSYGMDFAEKANEGDKVIEKGGVKVFLDSQSAGMLGGVTVDYVESLQESGFKFENPNAKASCGCGQSFR